MSATVTISADLPAGTYTLSPPTPAPAPPTGAGAPLSPKWMGLNLTAIGSTNREYPFIDWVKSARRFGGAAKTYDQSAPVDADGNPIGDFGLFWDSCRDVNGNYIVTVTGHATFKAYSCAISAPVYDATKNVTTATMTINQTAGAVFSPALAVYVNGEAGPHKISIIAPDGSKDGIFSDTFANSLDSSFRVLRFMDWARTNFSQQKTWADRPNSSDAQWSIKGVPWEICIALCNRLGVDGWFNVPCMADDDYVSQLAALINTRLAPGLHAYIEYSNEVWNSGTFGGSLGQATQHANATLAAIAAGDNTLALSGDPNPEYAQFRFTAKQSFRIRKLVDAVNPSRDRFRVVLPIGVNAGWQMLNKMIGWMDASYVAPGAGDAFYAVAIAPYFDESKALAAQASATADQLLDGFAAGIAPAVANLEAVEAATRARNMKLICYEMGIDDLQANVNLPNKIAAQTAPRMGGIVTDFLTQVYQHVDGGCWDSDACLYDQHSMFGLREHVRELYTPKYSAVRAFGRGLEASA